MFGDRLIWQDFEFVGNDKNMTILIDTHQYTAWNNRYESFDNFIISLQGWQAPSSKYPYLIGEWSMAIDNCQMWLNGFMDNLPDYPLFDCFYETCPKYKDFLFELSQAIYGPFGTGISYPIANYCPEASHSNVILICFYLKKNWQNKYLKLELMHLKKILLGGFIGTFE